MSATKGGPTVKIHKMPISPPIIKRAGGNGSQWPGQSPSRPDPNGTRPPDPGAKAAYDAVVTYDNTGVFGPA